MTEEFKKEDELKPDNPHQVLISTIVENRPLDGDLETFANVGKRTADRLRNRGWALVKKRNRTAAETRALTKRIAAFTLGANPEGWLVLDKNTRESALRDASALILDLDDAGFLIAPKGTQPDDGKPAGTANVVRLVPIPNIAQLIGLSKTEIKHVEELRKTGLFGATAHDVVMTLLRDGFRVAVSDNVLTNPNPSLD